MRDCRGCDRRLPVDAFGDGALCRRCRVTKPARWVVDDLEAKGYPSMGAVHRWYRLTVALLEMVDRDADEGERVCGYCGDPLPQRSTGRPAVYCSARCRRRAWTERNRTDAA